MSDNRKPIHPDPTPQEIMEACQRFQESWPPAERARRCGWCIEAEQVRFVEHNESDLAGVVRESRQISTHPL